MGVCGLARGCRGERGGGKDRKELLSGGITKYQTLDKYNRHSIANTTLIKGKVKVPYGPISRVIHYNFKISLQFTINIFIRYF